MWYIIYNVILYFYIGYTYLCWMNYRKGAGFNVSKMNDEMREAWVIPLTVWPIIMPIHCGVVFYDGYIDENKLFNKLRPEAFYNKGKEDNDIEKQSEKHLLGVK